MINLTPYIVVLQDPQGGQTTIRPSGKVAKITYSETVKESKHGLLVIDRGLAYISDLPSDNADCLVLPSLLSALKGVKGVYAPDTGDTAIRVK